ncbi:hypothetical protein MBAV_002526 [Candidatus Magnetobacterium bavaricum]|uniref:Uncharacterized protein n=1 Tax=Candidatus Magnetobacterium bavaricum TaxID=29290 RepID=A0A0F3GTN5_9BACT|nr:hypothetical protein MBAV_002526 [Candidatus Magnetobacterium bavaricum]
MFLYSKNSILHRYFFNKNFCPGTYYNTTMVNCASISDTLEFWCRRLSNKDIKAFTQSLTGGVGNLFPTYEFLKVWKSISGYQDAPPTTTATGYTNKFLISLNSDNKKAIMQDKCNGETSSCIQTVLFISEKHETAKHINVVKLGGSLYEDGEPSRILFVLNNSQLPEVITAENGDGTVVAAQAAAPFFNETENKYTIKYITDKDTSKDYGEHSAMLASK